MRESKECLECGGVYFRPEAYTQSQWDLRKYCTSVCSGLALQRRQKEAREQTKELAARETLELGEISPEPEEGEARSELGESKGIEGACPEPVEGIERELRVIRVGPNPKLVVCEYFELASRRTCKVLVKRTTKWVKGMRFKMVEPKGELEFTQPWVYEGKQPRWRGRF